MLSKYDLGGLLQLIFVPKEKIAKLELESHFLHLALEYLLIFRDFL
jgi:hypothetical protein